MRDPGNPAIPGSGIYALAPSVLYEPATATYRMWYTSNLPWAINEAVSEDAVHWFLYAKLAVLGGGGQPFEADGVVYAGVAYDGAQYRMYYTGVRGCCGFAVGLATSPDGLTWTKYAGNPILTGTAGEWDGGGISACNVYYDGTTYYLLYQGIGGSTSIAHLASSTIDAAATQQIGLATSSDGVTFVKSPNNPVIPRGGSGSWSEAGVFPGGVFAHHGTLYAFFTGADAGGSKEAMGLATSTNGMSWVQDARNPLFMGGSNGADWDWNIGSATPVLRDGVIQLWYAGNSDGGNDWSIGYASAPFDGATAVQASLLSASADANGAHLEWETRAAGPLTVFRRRDDGGSWHRQGVVTVLSGRARFDDGGVEPGARYAYGISPAAPDALLTPEVWLEIPVRPTLTLAAIRPNPSPSDPCASFTLPERGPVVFELFDAGGRRALPPRTTELAAGSHVMRLDPDSRLGPGLYMVRMSFQGRQLTQRAVVVR